MTDADDRPRFSRAEWVLVVVAVLFVAVQAVVPALVPRRDDRQVEFAWELYSKGAPRQLYLIVTDRGVEEFDLVADLPVRRAVIDYPTELPPWLCDTFDAVEIEVTVGDDRSTYPCR